MKKAPTQSRLTPCERSDLASLIAIFARTIFHESTEAGAVIMTVAGAVAEGCEIELADLIQPFCESHIAALVAKEVHQ